MAKTFFQLKIFGKGSIHSKYQKPMHLTLKCLWGITPPLMGEINPNTNQTCTTNFDSQCTTSCFSLQRHDTTMQFSEYVRIKTCCTYLKISFKNNAFYLVTTNV
uniref:Uncharacterized protein n=1 Tax=Cacopsylla melanoneura TaxID=428564 RepID=A0A8D8QV11_9HEMI